jgi:flagellar FliL protein
LVSRHGLGAASRLVSKGRIERPMTDTEVTDGATDVAQVAAPRRKLKLIIAGVAAFTVLVGGATTTWLLFFRNSGDEMHAQAAAIKPPAFVEVPEMLVNLVNAPGERVQYLKLRVVLEVKDEKQVDSIKPSMPRVSDIFQTYMRELRPADLSGSVGLFRLKEELTRRVNLAIAPTQVSAVLFKEIVVQ